MSLIQLEEDGDQHSPDTEKRQVNPKHPSPRNFLRKRTTKQWPGHRAETPHHAEEAEPLASLAERDGVDYNHLGQGDDASTTHTLDRATDKYGGEVVGNRWDDRAREEECQTNVNERLATEDVREGSEDGLEDCGREEEGGAGPKGFDC